MDPGEAEVFLKVRRNDGSLEPLTAAIDTGAETTLLPNDILNKVKHRLSERGTVTVQQAGIARQTFTVTEAFVILMLEDQFGTQTAEFEVRVWFADTDQALIGYHDILDRATLHIDMRETRSGYIELDN
jgi:hypothetical protein